MCVCVCVCACVHACVCICFNLCNNYMSCKLSMLMSSEPNEPIQESATQPLRKLFTMSLGMQYEG